VSRPFPCAYVVYAGDYLNPPEYCPNDADTPFSESFCGDHIPPPEAWDDDEDHFLDYWPLDPNDYEGFDE
jgi:hypothetical protein